MIRIACTALATRIFAGRVSKDGLSFAGETQDVTSDCLKAMIEFVGIDGTAKVHVDGAPKYEISVREIRRIK